MTNTIKIYRSSSNPIVAGVTALAFGVPAMTNIAGITKYYLGDSSNLAVEVAGDSFALKTYVDTKVAEAVNGLDWKQSARVASTTNINIATDLENGDIVDGITLATNDRVLLMGQTTASQNGVYTVPATGAAPRSTDADTSAEVTNGFTLFVGEGTSANKAFSLTTVDPIVLGTTALTFAQTSSTAIVAGLGLTFTGNTLDVNVDDASIEINADILRVKALGITNAMLAGSIADSKLSTITTANKVSGSAIQLAGGSAISDNTGLQVNTDNASLEVSAAALRIKDQGVTAAKIATSAVGDGLTGGAGTALSVVSDATGGANLSRSINVSVNGVAVKIDGASIIEGASNRLEVGTVDAGTF